MSKSKLFIFNEELEVNINSQELIGKIEDKLLETLWMELALYDKLQFEFEGWSGEARGSLFWPVSLETAGFVEGNIDEYFDAFDKRYLEWIDLEFEIDIDDFTIPNISEGFYPADFLNRSEKILVYCLKYGAKNNYLKLKNNFNENQILSPFGKGDHEEWGTYGIESKVTPNKEKIAKILEERNHTFGNLSEPAKLKIVMSLLDTKNNPHKSLSFKTEFPGISEHLLELISMHPQTSDELKAMISLAN